MQALFEQSGVIRVERRRSCSTPRCCWPTSRCRRGRGSPSWATPPRWAAGRRRAARRGTGARGRPVDAGATPPEVAAAASPGAESAARGGAARDRPRGRAPTRSSWCSCRRIASPGRGVRPGAARGGRGSGQAGGRDLPRGRGGAGRAGRARRGRRARAADRCPATRARSGRWPRSRRVERYARWRSGPAGEFVAPGIDGEAARELVAGERSTAPRSDAADEQSRATTTAAELLACYGIRSSPFRRVSERTRPSPPPRSSATRWRSRRSASGGGTAPISSGVRLDVGPSQGLRRAYARPGAADRPRRGLRAADGAQGGRRASSRSSTTRRSVRCCRSGSRGWPPSCSATARTGWCRCPTRTPRRWSALRGRRRCWPATAAPSRSVWTRWRTWCCGSAARRGPAGGALAGAGPGARLAEGVSVTGARVVLGPPPRARTPAPAGCADAAARERALRGRAEKKDAEKSPR